MNVRAKVILGIALVLCLAGLSVAEEKTSPSALKIQIVFSEYDGDKKVGSLPYVLTAAEGQDAGSQSRFRASLRLGISVPIATGGKEGESQTQYHDVGTNIDCDGRPLEDGRYRLQFNVERSSIYEGEGSSKTIPVSMMHSPGTPLLRRYRGAFDLLLKDGQTAQGPVATDPHTGRVLKTEVTLNVLR